MSSVWADGEEVTFKEGVPEQPGQIYDLLMGALSEQGRVVVKFVIDGIDLMQEDKQQVPESFTKIEAFSLTHDELTLRLIKEALKHLQGVDLQLEAYLRNILSVAWTEVFKRMDEFVGKVKPFAELLDNLAPYSNTYDPPWRERLEEVSREQAESLDKILTAFEQGNPALLSNELAINFLPIFGRTHKLFNEDVVPYLEKKVKEETAA